MVENLVNALWIIRAAQDDSIAYLHPSYHHERFIFYRFFCRPRSPARKPKPIYGPRSSG